MHLFTAMTALTHDMNNQLMHFVQNSFPDSGLFILLAMIDPEAALGAVLGGWVVTRSRRILKRWQHMASFALSACVGYLFTPAAAPHLPGLPVSVTAFICALLALPISIKVMTWVNTADITDILRRLRWPK